MNKPDSKSGLTIKYLNEVKNQTQKAAWDSISQDYDLTLKLIKFGLFDISNNYLVKIRNISSNMTNNKKFTLIA